MKKTMLIVGGTFDRDGGKPSSLISQMYDCINKNLVSCHLYNGGCVNTLQSNIINEVKNHDIVMWMPNVPNTEEKIRNVKEINPKTILISSKRNDNEKYDFAELITRALAMKSNLTIEFNKVGDKLFNMMVFDPLGNEFYNGTDIRAMTNALISRALKLVDFTRKPTIPVSEPFDKEIPNEEEFFAFARNCSDIFHNLINPSKDTTRFLGNMSFRCQNGFPSFKDDDGIVYVSKRNVDKSEITKESFVPTFLDKGENVRYYGDKKPSVDTPVQLRLYKLFPNMRYMIHAHCYFEIAPEFNTKATFTSNPVPCGAIEEVEEIVNALKDEYTGSNDFMAVNLKGHGCLLMASDVSCFAKLMKRKDSCFIRRIMPEKNNII